MAGTSTGKANASFVGARLTRACTYVPGYLKNGVAVNPKIYVPIAVNNRKKGGDASFFTLTAWGDKITKMFAHYLRKGKEMHFLNARLETYKWQQTNKETMPVLNNDGSPLMVDRNSYVITDFIWGSDSEATRQEDELLAQQEIAAGLRGPNYKIMGHPDHVAFKAREAARVAQAYMGGPKFGFADVSKKSLAFQGSNAYVPVAAGAGAVAQTILPANTTIVDPNAATPAVGQVTYESLIAAGWTDIQIMGDARFAVLKTAHDALLANNAAIAMNATTTPAPPNGAVAVGGSF